MTHAVGTVVVCDFESSVVSRKGGIMEDLEERIPCFICSAVGCTTSSRHHVSQSYKLKATKIVPPQWIALMLL